MGSVAAPFGDVKGIYDSFGQRGSWIADEWEINNEGEIVASQKPLPKNRIDIRPFVRETTIEKAALYRTDKGYEFPDSVVVGIATKERSP